MRYALYTIHFPEGPPWGMLLPENLPCPEVWLLGQRVRIRSELVPDEVTGLRRLEEIRSLESERSAS